MTDDDKDNCKYYNRMHYGLEDCIEYEDILDDLEDDDDNDDLLIGDNF